MPYITYDFHALTQEVDINLGPDSKPLFAVTIVNGNAILTATRPVHKWSGRVICGVENLSEYEIRYATIPTASVYSGASIAAVYSTNALLFAKPGERYSFPFHADNWAHDQTSAPGVVVWSPRTEVRGPAHPGGRYTIVTNCNILFNYFETPGGPKYRDQREFFFRAEPNNLSSLTTLYLYYQSALRLPSVPPGGTSTADYAYTLRADGPYRATVSYSVSTPDGGDGKIGDAKLRLRLGSGHQESGFADLSGKLSYLLLGAAGERSVNLRVEAHAPTNARLGSYRTNLRVNVAYQ